MRICIRSVLQNNLQEKTMQKILDVQTNEAIGERGLVNIFLPDGDGPFKFILGIHGGGWRNGDRNSYLNLLSRVLPKGYAIVNCSYRLRDVAKYPAPYEDLVHLLKWLKANGADYQLDTSSCVLLGGSAGGHLVALLDTKGTKEETDIVNIKGAVSYCPVLDMNIQYDFDIERESTLIAEFLGGKPDEKPELYKDASPISHIHEKMPPIWLAHGDADPCVSIENTRSFVEKLKKAGVYYEYTESPGDGHTMVKIFPPEVKVQDDNREMLFEESMLAFIKKCMND